MGRYLSQKNWKSYQLQGDGLTPVNGFTDGQGRFYFDDMSRGGSFAAQVTVDSTNTNYKEFFVDCRAPDRKGANLRQMRLSGANNHYQVSVRYLPKFVGLTNDPFKDQSFRDTHVDLTLNFSSSSILKTQEFLSGTTIKTITKLLRGQLANQPENGVYTFDLTGWDDAVCDLIQGRAQLTIAKTAMSGAPLIEQKRVIEPDDLTTLSRAIKSQQPSLSKEQAIYSAARTQSRLENDHQIKAYDEKVGFKIVMLLTDPANDDVACVSDQLQSYAENVVQQVFSIGLKLPNMDELNP
jgi:hypothetical protein